MSADDKRELLVIVLCIAGLFAIYKLVPPAVTAVGSRFGLEIGRPIALLFVALFMFLWGRFCLYLRYGNADENSDENSDKE